MTSEPVGDGIKARYHAALRAAYEQAQPHMRDLMVRSVIRLYADKQATAIGAAGEDRDGIELDLLFAAFQNGWLRSAISQDAAL